MAVRPKVQQLVDLGAFPASSDADKHDIDRRGAILTSITPPVTRDEALALLACFGPDEAFGLAWTLLHLIETAPGGPPIASKPGASENEWIRRMWERSHR
jgi:hypothetical protein